MVTIDIQLNALKEFADSENKQIVHTLEEILDDIAKTGQYIFQWIFLKPLFAYKLDKVTEEFLASNPPLLNDGSTDELMVDELKLFRLMLLQTFDKFMCAPFTIQRVSELLMNPGKHYKSTAKLFRGLEKNILVVSTIEPVSPEHRIILKRTHGEKETNGQSESELKPPFKKSIDDMSSESALICKETVKEEKTVEVVSQEESVIKNTETVIKDGGVSENIIETKSIEKNNATTEYCVDNKLPVSLQSKENTIINTDSDRQVECMEEDERKINKDETKNMEASLENNKDTHCDMEIPKKENIELEKHDKTPSTPKEELNNDDPTGLMLNTNSFPVCDLYEIYCNLDFPFNLGDNTEDTTKELDGR